MARSIAFLLVIALFAGFFSDAWAFACCPDTPAKIAAHDIPDHRHQDGAPEPEHFNPPSCIQGSVILDCPDMNIAERYPEPLRQEPDSDSIIPDDMIYPLDEPPKEF